MNGGSLSILQFRSKPYSTTPLMATLAIRTSSSWAANTQTAGHSACDGTYPPASIPIFLQSLLTPLARTVPCTPSSTDMKVRAKPRRRNVVTTSLVAHGWGSIFRSYTMAWTTHADFKLQPPLLNLTRKDAASPSPTAPMMTPEATAALRLPPVVLILWPRLHHPTSSLLSLRLLYQHRKGWPSRPMPRQFLPPKDPAAPIHMMATSLAGIPPTRRTSPPSRATVLGKPKPPKLTPTWNTVRPRHALQSQAHVPSTAPRHRSLAAPQG
jgi:hypothetical protein